MRSLEHQSAAWQALGEGATEAVAVPRPAKKVLVAGVGNQLRADDAFGVEVAHRLMAMELPEGVKVVETGIGGIALVQELQEGYDALVVIDAVDRGRPPGHVMLILLDVPHVNDMEWGERYDFLADVHLATPERALIMSKALGVLPDDTLMVGCQPVDAETPGIPMSPEVTAAIEVAIREVVAHLDKLMATDGQGGSGTDGQKDEPEG
ncbi:MAG: hydrogenase maturation protease [Actinomycetota bacterium]|nr:hydrogenase maturation protease [Actinomycetota bacterium]